VASFMKSKLIKYILLIALLIFLIIKFDNNISPTPSELYFLERTIGSLRIESKQDLIFIQNRVIEVIAQAPHDVTYPLDIISALRAKKGLCYERSLILQKIMISNGIKIRPVYVFYTLGSNETRYLDLLISKTDSHAIFEFEWDGVWYVCQTTTLMQKFIKIEAYLNSETSIVPRHSKYIRHINNLNSKFLGHWFIPDIY